MNDLRRLLAASLLAVSAPALGYEADDTDWTEHSPAQGDEAGAIGRYGAPQRERDEVRMREGMRDQLCRNFGGGVELGLGDGDAGAVLGGARRLLRGPGGQVYIQDEQRLRATLRGTPRLESGSAFLGVAIGGSIEGTSVVEIPAGTRNSCSAIRDLVDVRQAKSILPLTGERVSEMAVGEVWRIPMSVTYERAPSAGFSGFSISYGPSERGTASMTLYRRTEDSLRFRFRIEQVSVRGLQQVGVEGRVFPAASFAVQGLGFVSEYLEDELERAVVGWLRWAHPDSRSERLLMEFVIDPRDPAQAGALARAVRGEWDDLLEMARDMVLRRESRALEDFEGVRRRAQAVGDSTYAAVTESDRRGLDVDLRDGVDAGEVGYALRNSDMNLPFVFSRDVEAGRETRRVLRTDARQDGTRYTFFSADRRVRQDEIDLPLLGPLARADNNRVVEVITQTSPEGAVSGPAAVYLRNEGFHRLTATETRAPLLQINGVLALVGSRRGGDGRRMVLPVDRLAPPAEPRRRRSGAYGERGGDQLPAEPSDRSGNMSFTMALNERAVADILAAPEADVRAAMAAAGVDARGDASGRLLADLAAARAAATPEDRGQAMAGLLGGLEYERLAYEDAMRVLVQFVDPRDVTAHLVMTMRGQAPVLMSLTEGRDGIAFLDEAAEVRSREQQGQVTGRDY